MKHRIIRSTLLVLSAPILLQLGCFNAADFRAIAEGQFVAFVNALINSVTSDAIHAALGS